MKELIGHTSPDTAYVVDDYPYGFRLRTQIRYWIETKAGQGQRVVSQTRNPKRAGMPWNKPKASTYSPIRVLALIEQTSHVDTGVGLGNYATEEEVRAFMAQYPLTCAEERNAKVLIWIIARARAEKRITYTVRSEYVGNEPPAPRQSAEEQIAIMRKLTAIELSKLRAEQEAK